MSSNFDGQSGYRAIDHNNNNNLSVKTKPNQLIRGDSEAMKTCVLEPEGEGVRTVKLRQKEANSKLGFSLRGGKEATGSSVGVFVSHVERHSEADRKGLKIGDQLIQVNGLNVDQASYEEVIHLIRQTPRCNDICIKVNNFGKIPFQDKSGEPIKWLQVSDLLSGDQEQHKFNDEVVCHQNQNQNRNLDQNRVPDKNRKEMLLMAASGCSSSSSDEGLESYNGSHRLDGANSLSSADSEALLLSEPEPTSSSSSSTGTSSSGLIQLRCYNENAALLQQQQHDSAVSSTITTTSLDGESTCSSSSASSAAACSISISSLQTTSSSSARSSSSSGSDDDHSAGGGLVHRKQQLRETLVRVPGGRRTSEPFGCGVVKGPEEWPGIFVQSVKPGSLAERVGLQPGDQLTRADGQPLYELTFDAAISLIKGLQKQQSELELHVKKGAALRYLAERGNTTTTSISSSCQQHRKMPAPAAPERKSSDLVKVQDETMPAMRGDNDECAKEIREEASGITRFGGNKLHIAKQKQRQHSDSSSRRIDEEDSCKPSAAASHCSPPDCSEQTGGHCPQDAKSAEPAATADEWRQAKAGEQSTRSAKVIEQPKQLAGAREAPKQQLVRHKQQQQLVAAAPAATDRATRTDEDKLSLAESDEHSAEDEDDHDSSNSGSHVDAEQIRIVSQNCKLHYSHQSMQNYKQSLVMEKFQQQQRLAATRARQQQQPVQALVEPHRARRRQVVAEQDNVHRLQLPSSASSQRRSPVAARRLPPALQRHVSMDCLSVCGSNPHQQQQQQQYRRLRSSSATRQEVPVASSSNRLLVHRQRPTTIDDQSRLQPKLRMYRCSSSLILGGHQMSCCVGGAAASEAEDTRSCLVIGNAAGNSSASECSARTLSLATNRAIERQCCNLQQQSDAAYAMRNSNSDRLFNGGTLDPSMPLSRSKARSMDKLNMSINLNYVKIGLAANYRGHLAAAPGCAPVAASSRRRQHQQQQQQNLRQGQHMLLAPCTDELCCRNRIAILQQQQQRRPLQQQHQNIDYCYATTASGSASSGLRTRMRQHAAAACCPLDALQLAGSGGAPAAPYCHTTALSKQQFRRALLASQTLRLQQQATSCCHLAGYSCRPVIASCCATPVDRTSASSARRNVDPMRQHNYGASINESMQQHYNMSGAGERRIQPRTAAQSLIYCGRPLKLCPAASGGNQTSQRPPVPPTVPPMVPADGKLYSPRDTRQRLSTFLSVATPTTSCTAPSSSRCSMDSSRASSRAATCRSPSALSSHHSTSSASSMSSSTTTESGTLGAAAILLSHRKCLRASSTAAPVPPPPRVEQAPVPPCPPPPPAPDAEFECKIGRILAHERVNGSASNNKQQRQRAEAAAPQPEERPTSSGSGGGGSKQNRLCFVDELKMLAKRQQQSVAGQQQINLGAEIDQSATLIKIINASKSAQRAAAAAAAGCGSCCSGQNNHSRLTESASAGKCGCQSGKQEQIPARCCAKSCPSSHHYHCKPSVASATAAANKSVKLQDENSKRRQHEMLMKEFKSAHSRMFSKRKNLEEEEEEKEKDAGDKDTMTKLNEARARDDNGNQWQPSDVQPHMEPLHKDNHRPTTDLPAPTATEVASKQRTTIKTLNTKKISLLAVQSNPLHVAAAN